MHLAPQGIHSFSLIVCAYSYALICACSICDVAIIQRGSGKASDGAFTFQNTKKSLQMMSVHPIISLSVCPHSNEGIHMWPWYFHVVPESRQQNNESRKFRFLLLKRLPGSRPSESESGGLKCYILASHLAKEAFWVLSIPRHQMRALCRCPVPNAYMKVCTYGWKR